MRRLTTVILAIASRNRTPAKPNSLVFFTCLIFLIFNYVDLMKKFFPVLGVMLGLISNNIFAMNFIKSCFDQVANSPSWCNFCCFLVKVGNDVRDCDSYHAYEYGDLFKPSAYQYACLCYAELGGILSKTSHFLPHISMGQPVNDQCPLDKNYQLSSFTQNFYFSLNSGVKIHCSLNNNLQLLCCNNTECVLLDILSNDDERNNCCKVNEVREVICSKDLCSDMETARSPCEPNGDLHRKSIAETYNHHQRLIVSAIENLSSKPLKHLNKMFRAIESSSDDEDVKIIMKYFKSSAKNLDIHPCNEIQELRFSAMYNNGMAINDRKSTICSLGLQSQTTASLGYFYTEGRLPQLDFIIAHEYAHIYQTQELLKRGLNARDKTLIKPGFELSADILAALVANYSNLAAIGMQWLYDDEQPKPQFACSLSFGDSLVLKNIFQTDDVAQVHPSSKARGTILLKLSTMIKAAVKYLEHRDL